MARTTTTATATATDGTTDTTPADSRVETFIRGQKTGETLTPWGVDAVAKAALYGLDKMVVRRDLSCSDGVIIPSGTPANRLTPKNLARAIWAEWQSLPTRVPGGKYKAVFDGFAGGAAGGSNGSALDKILAGKTPEQAAAIKRALGIA